MLARQYSEGHGFLVNVMRELNYPVPQDAEYCAGICFAALISFYSSGDLTAFDGRIDLIQRTPELAQKIKDFQLKKSNESHSAVDKKIQYTAEEQNYVDILAFFETILLSHDPIAYKQIFNKAIPQTEAINVHQFFVSKHLENTAKTQQSKHSLILTKKWPGHYSKEELQNYLFAWHHACSEFQSDVAITLSSDTHRILLCYKQSTKRWILVDPKSLPSQSEFTLLGDVATTVYKSLHTKNRVALETCVYATPDKKKMLKNIVKKLEKSPVFIDIHAMTTEKVEYRSSDMFEFAFIASRHGHAKKLLALKKRGVDLTGATEDGWTLVHIAALNGYKKVIRALNEARVPLDKANQSGSTPFYLACQEGHVAAVKALLKTKKVKVDQPNLNGVTPAAIAKALGNDEILKLLKHQAGTVDFSPSMKTYRK